FKPQAGLWQTFSRTENCEKPHDTAGQSESGWLYLNNQIHLESSQAKSPDTLFDPTFYSLLST
ncbi:MAG: hypothetical protein PVF37_14435, partial [Desulfobacterales bacterium]